MSEVSKKKKKRRHSSSSTDFEAPNKRAKVETNTTADDSIVSSPLPIGLNCDASVVESRKKKHNHHHAAAVDDIIPSCGNEELNVTNTAGQYDINPVGVEHQTYMSELEEHSSHKRPKLVEQLDSSQQQQNATDSSQAVNRLYPPQPLR